MMIFFWWASIQYLENYTRRLWNYKQDSSHRNLTLGILFIVPTKPCSRRIIGMISVCPCVRLSVTQSWTLSRPQLVGWIMVQLGMEVALGLWQHCVRWGPSCLTAPNFWRCLLWPNGWMDQDAIWQEGRPRPRWHCVRGRPSFPQRGAQSPNFRPMSVVAKWLDQSRCHLIWK